jgi:ATP-dependent DNA helicase RecQ
MVDFFESDACLSKQLAGYFGDPIENERCGHCSFCETGKAIIPNTADLKPLAEFDFETITGDFRQVIAEQFSRTNLTRFLCGIYTPVFSKYKIKKLENFGVLENYPYSEVMNWVKAKAYAASVI